jgi:hypothetical protein
MSTCRSFYQSFMATKSTFIINAMPASALDSLQKLLSRSETQIEVIFPSQTLSMQKQGASDQLMNILVNLTNLTGLKLCRWTVDNHHIQDDLQKISSITTLRKLCAPFDTIDPSRLYNLTKLKVEMVVGDWRNLTKLQDLTVYQDSFHAPRELETFLADVSTLTRLHLGLNNANSNTFHFTLTTLSNLKDLNIYTYDFNWDEINVEIIATCTTLESITINPQQIGVLDPDWISSNTRLTHFDARLRNVTDWDRASQNLPNISSFTLEDTTTDRFKHLNLTQLDIQVLVYDEIRQYSALEELLFSSTSGPLDALTTLRHLTKLTAWLHPPSDFPTTLKYLYAQGEVKNLTAWTRLEELGLQTETHVTMKSFDGEKFAHLTKITLIFQQNQQAVSTLPKLSNLFALRGLYVHEPRNNNVLLNMDFFTTLTSLEELDIKNIDLDSQLLENFSSILTRLTALRISCSNSTGEFLTRFTKLRALNFASKCAGHNLRSLLEESLPRLCSLSCPETKLEESEEDDL